MSIEVAERLKKDLTDQYVVVDKSVPELKRFALLTGRVKTVNMNGRVLVEFNGPDDIGWYDIAPEYLTVVDAPQPVAKKAAPEAKPAPKKTSADQPAAKKSKGLSPLELARHHWLKLINLHRVVIDLFHPVSRHIRTRRYYFLAVGRINHLGPQRRHQFLEWLTLTLRFSHDVVVFLARQNRQKPVRNAFRAQKAQSLHSIQVNSHQYSKKDRSLC